MHCFRMNPAADDPQRLLTEEGQWMAPWGGSDDGERCDKCDGGGRTRYECWSCLLTERSDSCPVCSGAVRWDSECPVCRGTGTIDGRPRHGVSVFSKVEALYHYMLVKDADLDNCAIVELEADRAGEADFDADQGAMLVIPTRILACEPLDRDLLRRIEQRTVQPNRPIRSSPGSGSPR